MGKAAGGTGIGWGMIIAVRSAKRIYENSGTKFGEIIMVTVRSVVPPGDDWRQMMDFVVLREPFDKGGGFLTVGIDYHKPVIAATEHINIDQKPHF